MSLNELFSLASLVDNRIAKSAANAAIKEYNVLRNEPPKSADPINNLKSSTDGAKEKLTENPLPTVSEMDTEINEAMDPVKETVPEANSELMEQEKQSEQEERVISPEKSDAEDVPTNSRSGVDLDKSDERENLDGETTQVYFPIVIPKLLILYVCMYVILTLDWRSDCSGTHKSESEAVDAIGRETHPAVCC